MFLRAPGRETAPGEAVDLGEIGAAKAKDWERLTPYSPAVKIAGVKFENDVPRIAFVNDLEHPEQQPDGWRKHLCEIHVFIVEIPPSDRARAAVLSGAAFQVEILPANHNLKTTTRKARTCG